MPETILFLTARPKGSAPIAAGDEMQSIWEELERAGKSDRFRIEPRWSVGSADLLREILRQKPAYLHITCHGQGGGLKLADRVVAADDLVQTLAGRGLKGVILAVCNSFNIAQELARDMPFAVGMNKKIMDKACQEYTRGFYMSLAMGESPVLCHRNALDLVRLAGFSDEAEIPQLFTPESIAPRGGTGGEYESNGAATGGAVEDSRRAEDSRASLSPDELFARLRTLMQRCLDDHPELHAQLKTHLSEPVIDAIMQMTAVEIIDVLAKISWKSVPLREAVQRFAMIALPTAIDWRGLRAARKAGEAHVRLPFRSGPLCEIALAGLDGRPAELENEDDCPAAVRDPSGSLIPLRRDEKQSPKTVQAAVAEAILRKAGMKRSDLPPDDETLIKRAREEIEYWRSEEEPSDRYQMYLVFDEASPDAIESMVAVLPELWLVQGEPDRPVRLYNRLRKLYGWPKDSW